MNPRRTPTRKPARSIARLLLIELVAIAALLSALLYVAVKASSHQAAESTHDGLLAASAEAIAERLAADEGELVVDIPYGARPKCWWRRRAKANKQSYRQPRSGQL